MLWLLTDVLGLLALVDIIFVFLFSHDRYVRLAALEDLDPLPVLLLPGAPVVAIRERKP